MRVVYFGQDEFAVPPLMKLVNSVHEVAGIVVPSTGSLNVAAHATPVAVEANKYDLPVFVCENLAASDFVQELRRIKADLGVVIAFGQELPDLLREIFPGGCVGIHPSLLPKYRGPSPINCAILNSERTTGVTIFRMTDQPYAGPVLVRRETIIRPGEIWIELHFRLSRIACDAIDAALKSLDRDLHCVAVPQDESDASWAAEFTEEDGYLRFDESAEVISLRCRAMWPRPGTLCRYINQSGEVENLQIVRAKAEHGVIHLPPGTITPDFKITTAQGLLQIHELKPAKERVKRWQEFIKERGISPGERFEAIPR